MPYSTFSTPVNASLTTLWKILLEKLEDPRSYIADVEEVNFFEKNENGMLREIKVRGTLVKERITINEQVREIKSTLVDHPLFSGYLLNKIDIPTENSSDPLILTFSRNWHPLNEEAEKVNEAELAAHMQQVLLQTKKLAEQHDENQ
ncbi:AtaL-like protein [Nostoc sp.]